MISCMISWIYIYDIIHDIISQTPNSPCMCISSLAAANLPPTLSSGDLDAHREMDPDDARDYADQFPLSDRDMEEDN